MAKCARKVFEYLDYREFLGDYYKSRKAENPAFSLRAFSDRIGFKAKDFISRVMQGSKNLSAQSIQKIVSGLKLGKREATYFENLVWFNQAETTEEKNSRFEKMQNELKIVRFAKGQHLLAFYQYQVYSHWRHLAVRSLIGMNGFRGDFSFSPNPSIRQFPSKKPGNPSRYSKTAISSKRRKTVPTPW